MVVAGELFSYRGCLGFGEVAGLVGFGEVFDGDYGVTHGSFSHELLEFSEFFAHFIPFVKFVAQFSARCVSVVTTRSQNPG